MSKQEEIEDIFHYLGEAACALEGAMNAARRANELKIEHLVGRLLEGATAVRAALSQRMEPEKE
jgi:hypothetical protein